MNMAVKRPTCLGTAALLLASLVSRGAPAATDPAVAGTEPGVWQTHELTFQFMGFTATYSCDGLADTLQLLLDTIGAQKGAKVSPLCVRPFGEADRLATARLKFQTLQPHPDGAAPPPRGPPPPPPARPAPARPPPPPPAPRHRPRRRPWCPASGGTCTSRFASLISSAPAIVS